MQREIIQVVCDGCGKTAEMQNGFPARWKSFDLAYNSQSTMFDVCSSGCAEKRVIEIIRNTAYADQPKATL